MQLAAREQQQQVVRERLARALRHQLTDTQSQISVNAYDLGRTAMSTELSIPDIVVQSIQTLRDWFRDAELPATVNPALERLTLFLTECLAPFEMSHRGYRESVDTLRHVNETLEKEIERIGHALHDQAGQLMFSVQLAVRALELESSPASRPKIEDVARILQSVQDQLRDLSHELAPTMLADLGWYPALEFLVAAVTQRSGMHVTLEAADRGRFPPATETALYRAVQEALANAVRHSRARKVSVLVQKLPDRVTCIVADDGVGFEVHRLAAGSGLGLRALRERLISLNGSLLVNSSPGQGTRVEVQIPDGPT